MIGIDYASVDEHRARPDWRKAYSVGVRFAIMRAALGDWMDPTFGTEAAAARAAGIIVGAYLMPRIGVNRPTVAAQVQAFVNSAPLMRLVDFVPALDVEFGAHGIAGTGLTRAQCAAEVGKFRDALRAHYQCEPMIYTSRRVWNGRDADALNTSIAYPRSPLWLTPYVCSAGCPAILAPVGVKAPPVPEGWGGPDGWWIHQYQGDAVGFPGFGGKVDVNRFNMLDMRAELGLAARSALTPRGDWVGSQIRAFAARSSVTPNPDPVAALRDFQHAHELTPDACVGPRTFAALCWY